MVPLVLRGSSGSPWFFVVLLVLVVLRGSSGSPWFLWFSVVLLVLPGSSGSSGSRGSSASPWFFWFSVVLVVLHGSLVLLVGFPVLLAPKTPAIGTTCGNPGVRDWNESEERADGRA